MRSILRQRTATFIAVAGALAVALCGCSPEESIPSAAPTSARGEGPFATDGDALAAAQKTYEEFMAVANQIMAEGGASPERLDAVAAPELAAAEKEGIEDFAARKLTVDGSSTVSAAKLQSYTPDAKDGLAIVRAYFCINVSAVEVLDENGASAVQPTRPDTTPFEVVFDLDEYDPPHLIVSAKTVWGGEGIC
jgi:hypothetical protein